MKRVKASMRLPQREWFSLDYELGSQHTFFTENAVRWMIKSEFMRNYSSVKSLESWMSKIRCLEVRLESDSDRKAVELGP